MLLTRRLKKLFRKVAPAKPVAAPPKPEKPTIIYSRKSNHPFVFASLDGGGTAEVHDLSGAPARLSVRILDEKPVTLLCLVRYFTQMGTELSQEEVVLRASSDSLSFQPPEHAVKRFVEGKPYRLSAPLFVPANAAIVTIGFPATAKRSPLFAVQSLRIIEDGGERVLHAKHLYQALSGENAPSRVLLHLPNLPGSHHDYVSMLMSDVIGDGPAFVRAACYDQDKKPFPLQDQEARGRDGRRLFALPRVRKLDSPGRGLKTVPAAGDAKPVYFDTTVEMLRENATGYIDLMAFEVRLNKRLPQQKSRVALSFIATDYYEAAMAKSEDDLVKLLY